MVTDAQATATGTSTWRIDPVHSRVGFSVKHMLVTTVRGHFKGVSGRIVLDEADPARSSVAVEIDAASVDTADAHRDAHVRSGDFLLADAHPAITFTSTRVELEGATRGEVTGRSKNAHGADIIGVEATGRLNRQDWGVAFNAPLEVGGFAVGNELKL